MTEKEKQELEARRKEAAIKKHVLHALLFSPLRDSIFLLC